MVDNPTLLETQKLPWVMATEAIERVKAKPKLVERLLSTLGTIGLPSLGSLRLEVREAWTTRTYTLVTLYQPRLEQLAAWLKANSLDVSVTSLLNLRIVEAAMEALPQVIVNQQTEELIREDPKGD